MKIAQIAPLMESVPPRLYGGTERVVSYLTEELVRLGHEVTLFASGDSSTRARLSASCDRALRLDPTCQDSLAPHVRMLGQVYQRAREFDLIHCHTDYLGLPLARFSSTPTVLTLHGRLDIPELLPLYREYPNVPRTYAWGQRIAFYGDDYQKAVRRVSDQYAEELHVYVSG